MIHIRNLATIFGVAVMATTAVPGVLSQEEEESGTIGGLFKKVKEIKVPESVSNLPSQITELKASYLETAKAVEELRAEVQILRDEVYQLSKENEMLREAVGQKVEKDNISALLKPEEVSATDLVRRFADDRATADERYRDKYLAVVGAIESMEPGTQAIEIFLRAEGNETRVRCLVQTDNDFHVDVIPSQGRLISRNDRRTLLTVGQPVTIIGTCRGAGLNVELQNCRIDGLVEKKIEKQDDKKK